MEFHAVDVFQFAVAVTLRTCCSEKSVAKQKGDDSIFSSERIIRKPEVKHEWQEFPPLEGYKYALPKANQDEQTLLQYPLTVPTKSNLTSALTDLRQSCVRHTTAAHSSNNAIME